MSVQRCRQETTGNEFLEWMVYLDYEINSFHREDFYLAQIAREICALRAKKPNSIKIENFLLNFVEDKKVKETQKELSIKERTLRMQSWIYGLAGVPNAIRI